MPAHEVEAEWWCPTRQAACRGPEAVEAFVSHTAWDAPRKVRFLDHLSRKGDVRSACALVGMSRTSAYLLRRRDAAFARAWRAALVMARAYVEEVLATRALDGVEEAVWFRGEFVGMKRRYDTRLLLAHLGRLDALTACDEDSVGLEGRFDQALAVVAGEDARAHVPGLAEDHSGAVLPPARADYVREVAEEAFIAANSEWIAEIEALDREAEAQAGTEEEGLSEPDYPPCPEHADFVRESEGHWDGWQAVSFARVDACMEVEPGAMEYKSLSGPGTMLRNRRNCAALDSVNRVNLSPWGEGQCGGGQRFAGRRFVGQGARLDISGQAPGTHRAVYGYRE